MTSWLERFRSLASWKTLTFPIRLTLLAASLRPPRPAPPRPPRPRAARPRPRPAAAASAAACSAAAASRRRGLLGRERGLVGHALGLEARRSPRRRARPTPPWPRPRLRGSSRRSSRPMPSMVCRFSSVISRMWATPCTPGVDELLDDLLAAPRGARGSRSSSTMRAMRAISASTSWRFSSSLLMSMRQPTSLAARRTFWPFLPMARESCLSSTTTSMICCSSSSDRAPGSPWPERGRSPRSRWGRRSTPRCRSSRRAARG